MRTRAIIPTRAADTLGAPDDSGTDLGSKDNRPGWVLALGLLSIPGSTLAWELPSGGLWIGLPLAVAALVVGQRYRRDGGSSRIAIAGMICGAAMITMMVAWSLASVAGAKTKIYGGRSAPGGRIAMDVELSPNGKAAKRVTEVRAVGLLGTCEISGPNIQIGATVTGDMKVDADGRFKFKAVDDLGHPRSVKGRFTGKNDKTVEGTFLYEKLFPELGPWPEEVCTTSEQDYSLVKGGKNVIENVIKPSVAQRVGSALR